MDWPKIKTILIFVLIITNILLGYSYNKEKIRFQVEQENNLQDVIKLYASKGVEIKAKKLEFDSEIRSVNVSFDAYDVSHVDLLLGNEYQFDGNIYVEGDQFVFLTDSSILYGKEAHRDRVILDHEASLRLAKNVTIDEKELYVKKAQQFIEEHGFKTLKGNSEVLELGNYRLVKMTQNFEGVEFQESKTMIWFYEEDVVGFKRENIINISDTEGTKYDIISIDKVLYGLLPKLNEGDDIESINIIYKLNDESLLVTDLVIGEALPYYRIVTKSGEEYHVRAVVSL